MYIVEGNIGAGKSTFLKLIHEHTGIDVSFEPLHNWQKKINGQSLLENFYHNPQRWAYTLETFAMLCRVQEHIREQSNKNFYRLVERSIYSGHYCFALGGYENGFMNDLEWKFYMELFEFLIPKKCLPPRGFIYLRTNPERAYERIKKRHRAEEDTVELSYIKQLHTYHERFLILKEGLFDGLKNIPVLVLDVEDEFEQDQKVLSEHVRKVLNFMDL